MLHDRHRYISLCILRTLLLIVGMSLLPVACSPALSLGAVCEEWTAKIVSVQGSVQIQRASEKRWLPALRNDLLCPGDVIQVRPRSRAALALRNDAVLRLDQRTTLTISGLERQGFFLNLLDGIVHFFSRRPHTLRLATPFVNGGVEGTEFVVTADLEHHESFLFVLTGRVASANDAGSLTLVNGQAALAREGQAPVLQTGIRPLDVIQWALYYPPISMYQQQDFPGGGWQAMVRQSIDFYDQGDLTKAFASIADVPDDIPDPQFFSYRAALWLTVGRVDEARSDIHKALELDSRHSHAVALQSVLAVVLNRTSDALVLAEQAVQLAPTSAAAHVAHSYAQQARFDLRSALASLDTAVRLHPDNALVWSRLAELRLSIGDLSGALKAARQATSLQTHVARTQTVLGFVWLTQIKVGEAIRAFEQAIELDQAAPLPHLGLGLALIRQGDLETGRGEIELAASLDPNNALVRSYLGKAYYEEKRDARAANQLAIAKELDPFDPTPWFYDAIRKQSVNRPVEALRDLEKSIALNDNRAVYRSRFLLDEDLAVRSTALARIYDDLGFRQLALVEGWKSLNADPSNYSAHRFLADTYSVLPRHEIARVSELLQSQLLQPLNLTPIQPRLAESQQLILDGAGPAEASFNEYHPLFVRDRIALQGAAVGGQYDTFGDELVLSGIQQRVSYSLGQFYYQTDGFRDNHDLDQQIYNAFVQVSLSYRTSAQMELRYADTVQGDRNLRFDSDDFRPDLQDERKAKSLRLGLHHAFTPNSDLIASFIYSDVDTDFRDAFPVATFDLEREEEGYLGELQHILQSEAISVISGIGYTNVDSKEVIQTLFNLPIPSEPAVSDIDVRHFNAYLYTQFQYPRRVVWSIGASVDFFKGAVVDEKQFNPKFGVTWNPFPQTTLRASVFRVLKRTLLSDQTLEPTQVAGFNQFFDDGEGTDAWRYGLALDQKFSASLYGGVEFSKRDLDVPFVLAPVSPASTVREVGHVDWDEYLLRTYLYWTPHPWLATHAAFHYEKFDRDLEFVAGVKQVETYRVPLGLRLYHPSGFLSQLQATYIQQEGQFQPQLAEPGTAVPGKDEFWVVDAALGFRLPRRLGLLSLEVKNLFNEAFRFQDTDPANPSIQPKRFVLGRFTFSF